MKTSSLSLPAAMQVEMLLLRSQERLLQTCRRKKPLDCNWNRTSITSYRGALIPADSSSADPDMSTLSSRACTALS